MQFSKLFSKGIAFSALASSVTAAFDADSKENVVVYWGQASAGSQEDLSYYCESDDVDIVVLSFMTAFPGTNNVPTLNFASACYETFDNGLLKCTQIGEDIKTCQSNGKKILLSLGGAAGSYGFSSDSEAEDFAGTLWDLFGEGSSDTRPFGESVVDGFDFDIENNDPTGYAALATKLREYFSSGSKDYYLSAAPQCVYPDASVGDLLENADIDFAFVQFYNNYCNVDRDFNWDTWTKYAANTSPNKNIKIYLGLPGSTSAAGSGYVDISTVESTLKTIESDSAFGGVMLWDASQSFTNKVDGETYVGAIKDALESIGGSSSTSTSTTSTSSKVSSTTSSTSTSTKASTSAFPSDNKDVSSLIDFSSSSTPVASTTPASSSTPVVSSSAQTSESVSFPSVSTEPHTVSPVSKSSSTAASSEPVASSEQTTSSSAAATSEPIDSTTSVQTPEGPSSAPTPEGPSSEATSEGPSTVPSTSIIPVESTSSSLPYSEVTSNTFPTGPSTLSSVLVSTTEGQQTTTFSLSDIIEPTSSTTTGTSAAPSASGSSDCSSLTGVSKARCLNQAYKDGEYNGETSQCTHGSIACSASGEYAVCNWGSWVTFQCAAGTTCYAYNQGDEVFTGCNYSSQESQFTK